MFPGAKIILIDDDGDHLKAIEAAFRALGLACVTYKYPDDQPSEGVSFGGIRLFVTDINLLGGTSPGDEAQTIAPVVSLIERIISEKNGPYALITWSTTTLHEALVERIKASSSLSARQPFFSMPLAKSDFLGNPNELVKTVAGLFVDKAPFGALLDWERRVAEAGEKVLADVNTFSRSFAGDDPSAKMDQMLSKLAVDAFGREHVADHVFESVNEALLPLLNDALNVQFFSSTDPGIWTKAVTQYEKDNSIGADVVATLNSAVVFEASADIKPYRRGAVLALPAAWESDAEFVTRFGATPAQIRGSILKLDTPKTLRWVLIQAQAACDFAQPRLGPIPYLLGAIVPVEAVRKTDTSGKELAQPSSVWISPTLSNFESVNKGNFCFGIVHNMACHLSMKTLEGGGFEVLGRLKDQIVNSIAYEHHSHGSRPGYVSFR